MNRNRYFLLTIVLSTLFFTPGWGTALAQSEIPRPAHLMLIEISKLMASNQYDQAIFKLEAFQKKASANNRSSKRTGNHHYLVTFALGNCYLNTALPDRAVEKYRIVTKDNPHYLPAWSNLGKAYLQLQQHKKAAESFEQAFELSNRLESQFLYLAAAAYLADGQPKFALERMLLLKKNHPREFTATRQETQVQALFALNRFREALPLIQNIIRTVQGPRKKTWQEILLYQYISLKMQPAATALAEELVQQYPLEPKWWKGLAHLYLAANRLDETLISMIVYNRLQPLSAEEKKMLASLNLSLNLPRQAARLYEALAEVKPEPQIIRNLAYSQLKLGDTDAALKWIDFGLQQFEDTDLLLLKANLHFNQEQFELASSASEKLTRSDPGQGQAWLMWGYSNWKLGKVKTAREALVKATKFKQQKIAALALLKQLEPN